MAKYIIDIPEEVKNIQGIVQDYGIVPVNLIPYTEPDRKTIEDAQEKAWELASAIICPSDCNVGSIQRHCKEIFGVNTWEIRDIFTNNTYQEAKTKYEAWMKQRDEIRVGDEVKHRGLNYVVGYVGADKVYHLIDKNWLRTVVQGGYQLIKTGRHFDEVEELLKKMRDSDD